MAIRFSGNTPAYVSSVVPAGAFTLTCWVKVDVDRNAFTCFAGFFNSTSVYRYIGTATNGTTLTAFCLGTNAVGADLTVGTWYKVGLVVSGTVSTLYYAPTGSALSVSTGQAGTSAVTQIQIGNDPFSEALNGSIANLKVWTAALSQDEVAADLAQYNPVRTADLQRYHPFKVAETADYSGNGNTLSGGSGVSTTTGPSIPDAVPTASTEPGRFLLAI